MSESEQRKHVDRLNHQARYTTVLYLTKSSPELPCPSCSFSHMTASTSGEDRGHIFGQLEILGSQIFLIFFLFFIFKYNIIYSQYIYID